MDRQARYLVVAAAVVLVVGAALGLLVMRGLPVAAERQRAAQEADLIAQARELSINEYMRVAFQGLPVVDRAAERREAERIWEMSVSGPARTEWVTDRRVIVTFPSHTGGNWAVVRIVRTPDGNWLMAVER